MRAYGFVLWWERERKWYPHLIEAVEASRLPLIGGFLMGMFS